MKDAPEIRYGARPGQIMTFRGKPINGDMTKGELLEACRFALSDCEFYRLALERKTQSEARWFRIACDASEASNERPGPFDRPGLPLIGGLLFFVSVGALLWL